MFKTNTMRFLSILALFTCLHSVLIIANNSEDNKAAIFPGEYIVQLQNDADVFQLMEDFSRFNDVPTRLCMKKILSERLDIYLLHFDDSRIEQEAFKAAIFKHEMVKLIQNNHVIEKRETIPNDPEFPAQWQYINTGANGGTVGADIDADLAWDIATGGVTPLGDTIVVAIIDDGIDLSHDDFGDNLWVNHNEIPGNGIDDDLNGYVDDYRGWNIDSNDDDISGGGFFGGGHGTPVAGIVGAKGNNEIGVAGVNWNVKLMIIVGGGGEADAVASYAYCLEERAIYNETGGLDGAFVVSTNASWGIDFGQPEDAPIWCAMYDELGEQGIVSCGATINGNQNVDVVGDLPTACPSDYLISVTNMNRNDVKVTGAGYGLETIDLGAFGQDTWTCASGNSYGGFGGTSGATPHVAGAVALMYSANCPQLTQLAKTEPAQAALLVKSFILDGIDPNASLDGITTTGGRLNLYNSLQLVTAYDCAGTGCFPPYNIGVNNVIDESVDFTWEAIEGVQGFTFEYKASSDTEWSSVDVSEATYTLTGLTACTSYDVQIYADCDTISSGPSFTYTFTTEGCCIPPSNINIDIVTDNSVQFSWNNVFAASEYIVEYRTLGSSDWTSINVGSLTLTALFDLMSCSTYEIRVGTLCNDGQTSSFSNIVTVDIGGCGPCIDNTYCESSGEEADFEWISEVSIGDFTNTSGSNDGYAAFTSGFITLQQGDTLDISLTADYAFDTYEEYFKIWIDYNQNGEFSPQAELAFESEFAITGTTTGTIVIPEDAPLGSSRMRVSMKWIADDNTPSEPCDIFEYGEVEDYCVLIEEGFVDVCAVSVPTGLGTVSVDAYEAELSWDENPNCDSYTLRYRILGDDDWNAVSTSDANTILSELNHNTNYEFQVRCNCNVGVSDYSDSVNFSTQLDVGVFDWNGNSWQVYPNPFSSFISINTNSLATNETTTISLFDVSGKLIIANTMNTNELRLNTNDLQQGIYLLNLTTDNSNKVVKLMKTN